jgi:hypothetical protein
MSAIRTPGAKMLYLIKRRPTTTRDELVAHWFANHMPVVIKAQSDAETAGRLHARRYLVTLFDADREGVHAWDGLAQLWWDRPLPRPERPYGTTPRDSFQEKAEPYLPWATIEHVVMEGSDRLAVEPLRWGAPFPTTRSGFLRLSFLVKAKPGVDYGAFFDHWLRVHVPNVKGTMEKVGGFRYVVSHSLEPEREPYAGLAELYFPDASGWAAYREEIQPDGMEALVDPQGARVLRGSTDMIGIP